MTVRKHLILALAILVSPCAIAEVASPAPSHLAQANATPHANEMSEGEVRKVDKGAGKITLRHGEIRNLDMPSMTMIFQVRDKSMLDKVKTGDKVRFSAEKSNGTLVVTALEAAK